jgi:hypothetical protein
MNGSGRWSAAGFAFAIIELPLAAKTVMPKLIAIIGTIWRLNICIVISFIRNMKLAQPGRLRDPSANTLASYVNWNHGSPICHHGTDHPSVQNLVYPKEVVVFACPLASR